MCDYEYNNEEKDAQGLGKDQDEHICTQLQINSERKPGIGAKEARE